MMMVLAMAGAIWGIGAAMGTPHQARWTMLGLLLVGVLAIQIALPDGHPLREATGSSPAFWLMLIGLIGVVWGYRKLLGVVSARARALEDQREEPAAPSGGFSEVELNRYARHIVLREIGGPGQSALKRAKVLVVGAGGLGSPALQYLAAAGVGQIGVIDDDTVSGPNLQRQVLFRDAQIGMPKVQAAQDVLTALNPFVEVRPYQRRLTPEIAEDLIADYDIVLEGSDNFATRRAVNAACVKLGKPMVSGALSQWEGQVSIFDSAKGGPCYACVFPEDPADGLAPSCAEAGVLGPLPGVVGSMMAGETIKLVTGAGDPLRGRMMIFDAAYAEARVITVGRRSGCPVCGG